MASTASFAEKLFTDAANLPSLKCRRRYLDAMLVSREFKAGSTDFSKRVAPEDQIRLVRERFALLKQCMLGGDDGGKKYPYLYDLKH